MSLNKVLLIGNLTRDPEVRSTPSGQQVASFAVATNRSWTTPSGEKQEKVEYTNVVAWGKLAEIAGKYLGKGRKVYVEGRLQTRDWDGQDGVKRYRTEVVAENFIMLDRGPGGTGDGAPRGPFGGGSSASSNAPMEQSEPIEQPFPGEEGEIQLENIPF